MKTFSIIVHSGFMLSMIAAASLVQAQDFVPFGGRGIPDNNPIPYSNRAIKKADEPGDSQPFRLFGGQGVMRPAKPREIEDRPRWLGSMFPEHDPDQPNFFERSSQRSREFWGRTKTWTQDQNQQFRERTAESWENLTRGLRPSQTAPPPAASNGPIRTAENPDRGTAKF